MAHPTELADLRDGARRYGAIFLAVAVPVSLLTHVMTDQSMPWWPDTVVMGVPFGVVAALSTWHHRQGTSLRDVLKAVMQRRS